MTDSSLPISSAKHRLLTKSADTSKPNFIPFTGRKSLSFAFGFTFIFIPSTFLLLYIQSFSGYSFPFSSLISHFLSNSSSLSHQHHTLLHVPNESPLADAKYGVHSLSQEYNLTSEKSPLLSAGLNDTVAQHGKVDAGNDSHGEEEQYALKRENGDKKRAVEKERVESNVLALDSKGRDRNTKIEKWVRKMEQCNWFDGKWGKDDSYPIFAPGSCPHIDEPFNCFINGRLDSEYQKYRWQPRHCNIPRMNGKIMLEMLRGKRLVFVGDSLNRNMWESLVCILRNSVEDKSKVFEASGREEFRSESSYSFIFEDYNSSVEFFQSPFLVQEWEMEGKNGSKKETLRLDMLERSSDNYKTADVLIFNSGHWWTHEKTLDGRGYYQEGSHVYSQLNVDKAFRKALRTWARWVETKTDPFKTLVFFRGYSVSHFRGGEWDSGGKCDSETKPLMEETYFEEDPPMVKILESTLKRMKTPVFYLNVTRMTNFRRDAHPSVYREQNMTEEGRSLSRVQDCSHWCLPGVPDTWNEIVYSHLLFKHKQKELKQQQQRLVHNSMRLH
ncbi:hypothetical protein POPTR_001G010900v4 [Populus trichocarpa]|uniref:Uncharacterized protein n=1 Tax=Populus trichocarpa TaxID=3694 RepID=A0A2K2BQN2_POPTR|nr:protein trichome birefringence-like 1 [Populus trichocarpa]PNT52080.2 hypothetical protein POPTR_001G010900v4 [Populus trichocarpa]